MEHTVNLLENNLFGKRVVGIVGSLGITELHYKIIPVEDQLTVEPRLKVLARATLALRSTLLCI